MPTINLDYEVPEKLLPLYSPRRYKILYGGRGGSKSWGVARALLEMGLEKKLRVLCAREYQNSIKDSVHRLLSDQISEMGLSDFYEIQQTSIKGRNGTEFTFEGLKHNIVKIKSYEGADICWVEEAQTVSKTSWDVLIPTIRKEESEIWATFNPELETDETYQRFVLNPPPGAWVQKINYTDNPWFPAVLEEERQYLKAKDMDAYLNVWEGHCRLTLDGAIYAKELREAQDNGRICKVPYDQTKPVHTFWDLGWSDKTTIWFAQAIGMEYRIIDFYENRHQSINHYLKVLQERGYVYGYDYLPHDSRAKQLATGRSIEEIMIAATRKVQVIPNTSIEQGINAARTIFPNCYFDEEKCADGLQSLRHYRYDVKEDGQFSKRPLHDENSHAADGFRYLALSLVERKTKTRVRGRQSQGSWMG